MGFDELRPFGICFDFLTQPADLVVNTAIKHTRVAAPGQVEELVTAQNYLRMG